MGGIIDNFSASIFGDCDEVDIPLRRTFTVNQSSGEVAIAWDQASSDAYLGAGIGADIFIEVVDGQLMIDGKDFTRSEKVASCESLRKLGRVSSCDAHEFDDLTDDGNFFHSFDGLNFRRFSRTLESGRLTFEN